MAFWSSHDLQPKRKFRWILRMGGGNSDVLQVAAKTVQKPNYTLTSTTHKFLNHNFYFPNRVEWQPITVTFTDAAVLGSGNRSVSDILHAALGASGYKLPNASNELRDCDFAVTKKASVEAIGKQFELVQIGAEDGEVLETWVLTNPWISKITFGDLSYDDDGLVEISIDIVYDYADYLSAASSAVKNLASKVSNFVS